MKKVYNIFIMPKKSNFLETMKPEQKFRVDLEQISLGCHGPWWADPRFYPSSPVMGKK